MSLYDYGLATYDAADAFRHADAEGFVRLWGLGVQTWAAARASGSWLPPPYGRPGGALEAPLGTLATLWHGRFDDGPAEELLAFTVSLAYDRRLAPYDLVGSRAHVRGPGAGRGPDARATPATILAALDQVEEELADGEFVFQPATRTSTPPSSGGSPRSPATPGPGCTPVAAATTRWPPTCGCVPRTGRRRAGPGDRASSSEVLLERAADAGDAYLPGYTHLQRAQPVLLAHHLLAHAWALARDVDRLLDHPAPPGRVARSAPGRWPGRRCRSTPTAWPPTSASTSASRTPSTR